MEHDKRSPQRQAATDVDDPQPLIAGPRIVRPIEPASIKPSHIAEIARKAPGFPFACFLKAVADYRNTSAGPTASEAVAELDRACNLATELVGILYKQAPNLETAVRRELTKRYPGGSWHQPPDEIRRLTRDISHLANTIEIARRDKESEIRRGAGISPQSQLVHALAKGLQGIGRKPDAKQGGPLCNLVSIALEAAGADQPANLGGTVRAALKTLEKPC